MEINLYRIAQEALNNVRKHAQSTRVDVILERRGADLMLVVEDDGNGFEADERGVPAGGTQGLGLLGMRERAALMGGTIEIESAPGEGTTVFARVPSADAEA